MIKQQINLSYKNIHGNSFKGDVDELFKGLTEDFAFGLIDLINRNEKNYKTTNGLINYLASWFSRENNKIFQFYTAAIGQHTKLFSDCEITIFNPPSTLSFIERLIMYLQAQKTRVSERPSNQTMEINLLDAYLIINESLNKANDNGLKEIEKSHPVEAKHWLFLYKPFQYADLINTNLLELFLTENAKAIMLFEHIDGNHLTKPILDAFIARYNCGTWGNYLKAISGMAITGLNTPNKPGNSLVHIDTELPFYDTCIKILDRISVQVDMAEFAVDYLYLRNHPIHRTGPGKFQILSQRFFLEKIFRALYFELREINVKLKVVSDNRFRTEVYTSGYSENKLFYSVLNQVFSKATSVRAGVYMENIDANFGASDYVAEYDRNVFIFESKDILIRKEVKDKLYIPEIRDEFRKKFYIDGNSDKAVLQLAKNVKKLLDGKYSKFGFAPRKFCFIYPVIVVHSEAFNVLALNQILFKWFNEACKEAGISKKEMYKVKPVVLIDISSLLYFQDHINNGKTQLADLISNYIDRTKLQINSNPKYNSAVQYGSSYLLPFSFYLNHTIKSAKKIRTPRSLIYMMKNSLLK